MFRNVLVSAGRHEYPRGPLPPADSLTIERVTLHGHPLRVGARALDSGRGGNYADMVVPLATTSSAGQAGSVLRFC